jgi:acyl carrier protein
MANSGQAAHETEVRAAIRKQLAKVLFLKEEAIDEDRPFVELGLDSILAVELVRFLNRTYRIELKTSRLFDCPTVAALGKRVSELSSRRDEPMAQDAVSESHRDNPQPATSTAPAPVTGQHRIRELIAARLSEVRQ